ncbi:MAG: GNAT family N-acetyltransferase [Alphaproteobacteria bacterium]|jgi:GNAT superfamily N-acetyltransferase|nr:GNAT family N-acetyltransferase [Alphaproteobacteria bacterium]
MTEDITLRDAVAQDAPAIANVHVQSWRATYRGIMDDAYLDGPVEDERARVWAERMGAAEPPLVVVAEKAGEMVGFACAFPAEDAKWGTRIDNLHVRPGHQRQGIATRMMRSLAKRIATVEPELPVFLWVYDVNAVARAAYRALGGQASEKGTRTGADGSVTAAWRMTWPQPLAIGAEQ